MPDYQYDLVVIGSGPAGQKAAICAAKLRKRVVVTDRRHMLGGASLHTGTIPSKTLREAILYLSGFSQRSFYGKGYSVKDRISVADLAFRVQAVVKRELEVVRSQLKRNDVTSLAGGARFLDPHTVEVSTETGPQTVTGEHILVACGTWPAHNPEIPLDGKRIVDSDQLLAAAEIPRELIVVGAGVIGLEYASMMTALNVKVTLIDQRPCPLEYDRRTEHASRRTLIAPSRTARGPVQPRSYLDGTAPSGVPRAESRPVCFYPSRTEYSPA